MSTRPWASRTHHVPRDPTSLLYLRTSAFLVKPLLKKKIKKKSRHLNYILIWFSRRFLGNVSNWEVNSDCNKILHKYLHQPWLYFKRRDFFPLAHAAKVVSWQASEKTRSGSHFFPEQIHHRAIGRFIFPMSPPDSIISLPKRFHVYPERAVAQVRQRHQRFIQITRGGRRGGKTSSKLQHIKRNLLDVLCGQDAS